ncbi:hypothetical protein SKAU_G00183660 [Synaphobranchus kaupii]|uniref:TERF1-interacting nuclear factor 2 N-terminal domain-containing protein n=1 Tax=Synaphobranchus kaupii TaxID=118154 RepID=A0A9Q1FC84_SYNKA|nr:hypothetical protein SKAU_G00183660 [Synaphobranchus kaupii]
MGFGSFYSLTDWAIPTIHYNGPSLPLKPETREVACQCETEWVTSPSTTSRATQVGLKLRQVPRRSKDPSLPVSSLHLLVPPLQLLSAAMWQVLQQQDVLHYGKLEEFVSLVTEAFPELLSESQRTELTLGLQQSGCKTDPALEVLLWEFLSTLDQLLPVPDLTQTVSWLSAAPSVLEVCLQSVYYPDQLKTILRHHRSLGQLNMNATLRAIEEYKLSSTSRPPCQRVVDFTNLTNANSQSESITDCMNCLRPASSDEGIQAESVMDSSDYTGMEPTSISNRCEDIDEKRERKTGYLMSRDKKDLLTNMKEEEEDGERQSVKMEREDGVRDEEELWKEEEETDEQMEGHAADLVAQTDKLLKNGIKSEHAQWKGEELSTLVTSCLLKKPRVLIRRLEIANSSLTLSPPPHLVACQRGQGARSPWGQHELSPLRGNGSLTQKKGQVVNRKRNTISQLERPPKMLPSSSENGICAEASLISPVVTPRNQNTGSDHTGQTVEVSSPVFACSQCPFVDTEEVNLNQHIEKVHPEELNTTVRSWRIASRPQSFSNVAILDPAQLPDPVPDDYGLVEAGCLVAHYSAGEGIIDPVAVEDEWLSLREYMKLNRQLMQEQLARSLLSGDTI